MTSVIDTSSIHLRHEAAIHEIHEADCDALKCLG